MLVEGKWLNDWQMKERTDATGRFLRQESSRKVDPTRIVPLGPERIFTE